MGDRGPFAVALLQYTHNHRTVQNSPVMGCSSGFWNATDEPRAYPAFLAAAGYRAGFWGKYLNSYGAADSAQPLSHIPPGWAEWGALQGNSRFYDYTLSVNGVPEKHGSDYVSGCPPPP